MFRHDAPSEQSEFAPVEGSVLGPWIHIEDFCYGKGRRSLSADDSGNSAADTERIDEVEVVEEVDESIAVEIG